jgi:hypothetical protein
MENIFEILLLILSAIGILVSIKFAIVAHRIKSMPSGETYTKSIAHTIKSGIDVSHGMVRSRDGKGVEADSRISTTYLKSLF